MIFTLDLRAFTDSIDDLTLEQLSRENPELRFETNQDGKLIVMPPTGSQSGKYNGDLLIQVGIWNRQHKLGVVFDSSTGFRLSNGALRSPDVSWIAIERWNSLSPKQKRGFAPIDPDFVIELLSPTDQLTETQQKMREYIDCGIKLGWLIIPGVKQVEIYRLGQDKEVVNHPDNLTGEEILPGLIINLSEIFE